MRRIGALSGMNEQIEYAVGDINSQERGTGARANAGKVPYDLIPIATWQKVWQGQINQFPESDKELLTNLLSYLRSWQEGKTFYIDHAVVTTTGFIDFAARVFDYGKKKYAAWNWVKGMPWSVPLGCILRHLESVLYEVDMECCDDESCLPHMGHVLCNLIMLQHYAVHYPEGDDRPPAHLFNTQQIVGLKVTTDPEADRIKWDNEYDEMLARRRGEKKC